MEKRSHIILRHKESGLFYSYMADHTTKLWSAWRFDDAEYLAIWLENHSYAPENPGDYEQLEVVSTISIKECENADT